MPHGSPSGHSAAHAAQQPIPPSCSPAGSSPGQDTGLRTSRGKGRLHTDTEQELGAPSPRVCRQKDSSELSISVPLQIAASRAPSSLPNRFPLPSGKRSFPGK